MPTPERPEAAETPQAQVLQAHATIEDFAQSYHRLICVKLNREWQATGKDLASVSERMGIPHEQVLGAFSPNGCPMTIAATIQYVSASGYCFLIVFGDGGYYVIQTADDLRNYAKILTLKPILRRDWVHILGSPYISLSTASLMNLRFDKFIRLLLLFGASVVVIGGIKRRFSFRACSIMNPLTPDGAVAASLKHYRRVNNDE